MAESEQRQNVHAEHGDPGVEELREKYGDLANLTVGELQDRAKEQGINHPSGMRKEELLQALTSYR